MTDVTCRYAGKLLCRTRPNFCSWGALQLLPLWQGAGVKMVKVKGLPEALDFREVALRHPLLLTDQHTADVSALPHVRLRLRPPASPQPDAAS